jgi:serine/threonine-protein kinase
MRFQVGDLVLNERYRIAEQIGAGAFGDVYRAEHVGLRAQRVLKVLRRDAPGVGSSAYTEVRQRFRLEAQLGERLQYADHVVRVYDFEEIADALVLVMAYAAGGSLADRLTEARQARRPLDVAAAVRIARGAARGLAALHALDAVHRDVKPSNILFDGEGRVLLADFGLAQVPGGPSMRSRLSDAAMHPGTPAYKSPEQRTTGEYLTPASDVYAVGAVLFEMLTGRVQRSVRPGTAVLDLRAEVPVWLDGLVMRCLAEVPEDRPWDGEELEAALAEGEAQWGEARASSPPANASVGDTWTRPADGAEMVYVPAGEFLMGSTADDENAPDREKPQHKVTLDAFWIDKYEVTNAQYAAFLNAEGNQEEGGVTWLGAGSDHVRIHERGGVWEADSGYADHPVVMISWYGARAYAAWVGGRLPTEAEWEKAARGTEGQRYPWGNESPADDLCNFDSNVGGPTPVGTYSPQGDSPYGCADMAGNVWEWVEDWYDADYYTVSPDSNPEGPAGGDARVLRGGSFVSPPSSVRCAYRFGYFPYRRNNYVGFRVVVSPSL